MTTASEKRRVLGACVKVDAQHNCAFFEALAVENAEGHFSKVINGRLEFPTRGSFRVMPEDLHIVMPAFGSIGFFAVEADPHFGDTRGKSPSQFRANAILYDSVRMVVELPYASKDSTEVGVLLRKGVTLKNIVGPRATVMIRFTDGIIAGPFTLKQAPGGQLFTAEEQSLHQPKTAWSDVRKLLIETHGTNSGAVAFCLGLLPPPDSFLNFGPIELALRKVLSELAGQTEARAAGLTKGKANSYSILLSKLDPAEHTGARMDAVAAALRAVEQFEGNWQNLLDKVLADPRVLTILEQEKTKARAEALEQLTTDHKAARDAAAAAKRELASVASSLAARKAELETATGTLDALAKKISTAESEFAEKVRSEAERLIAAPEKLVAAAALLRPVFGVPIGDQNSRSFQSERLVPRKQENPSATMLSADRDAFNFLKQNLEAVGIYVSYAGSLAATILAAVASGLVVTIRGSMAEPLTDVLRTSLFASRSYEFSVPVGYSELIDRSIFPVDAGTEAIFLLGANRSCLDAYAAPLTAALLRARMMKRRVPAYIFLSLVEGPSGLPINAAYSELGPVIHTDALPWSPKTGVDLRPGTWAIENGTRSFDISADDYDEVRRAVAEWPNTAFDSAARLFLPALIHFQGMATTVAASTNAWSAFSNWLLAPYVAANRGSADVVAKHTAPAHESKVREAHLKLLFQNREP